MAAPSPSPPPSFHSDKASYFLRTTSNFHHLKQTHAKIIKHNLQSDQQLIRSLITLSTSFGQTHYASLVFHQLQSPSTFTYNLMIRSLSLNNKPIKALLVFLSMLNKNTKLDKFTFPFVIKACSELRTGEQVHGLCIKQGFYKDLIFQNVLMDFYFKFGDLESARKVFDKMSVRSIVSWTTMVNGLVFSEELDAAEVVFNEMPVRNVVSWTTMINGYVKGRRPDEVFRLFRRMQEEGVVANEFTVVGLLQACTQLGSLSMGRWVHEYAYRNGFVFDCFLGTALIDMYSKCGSLEDARKVFDVVEGKSLATWNSMITSLGVHGCGDEALALFEEMEEEGGVEPDAITFVGVLSACANIGNVKDGLRYFLRMIHVYGITPIQEHSTCMIQLLAHAREMDRVSKLVDSTCSDPDPNSSFDIEDTDRVNGRYETPSQDQIMFSKWEVG